jgi:hypothetical protein
VKTFVLCTALVTLGAVGCSHPQQATRPSANELPYHQPGKRGPRPEPVDKASSQRECPPVQGSAAGGSGSTESTSSNANSETCPADN